MSEDKRGKITGIGGIFFKCKDPESIKNWYSQHFQMDTDKYGFMFKSRDLNNPDQTTYLQWSPFTQDTKYMEPSTNDYMINYRVENIEALVEELRSAGVTILDKIASYDYGKFVHIMDPENNKIELWEPIDKAFDEYHK